MDSITLAGGCFWCTEAIFKRLKGVEEVRSGYANSDKKDPSYEEVCSGLTGAAEAIQLKFDSKVIPLEKLLDIFFATHDPTTLNRQGADTGTQYRSAIFYDNENQKKMVQDYIEGLENSGKYKNRIVTKLERLENFYSAEDYHKDYYDQNKYQPYCQFVIDPKIAKLLKEYRKDVKDEYIR